MGIAGVGAYSGVSTYYSNLDDAKRVEDFIAGFKNDENLKFAGIKEFWTMFLKGNITKDNLVQSGDTWEWIQ